MEKRQSHDGFASFIIKGDALNLPQFNGHFKKYTESYTMEKKGVSDEKAEAVV
jgi:hypothetical protein